MAVAEFLREGDLIFSNHRCHGHFLARTDDVEGLIAEVMGKRTGGRGGSQHLCQKGFFSNGIQGGIVPVSAGLALAQKIQSTGNIAVVFIGDGTLGEGAVYETLNVASKWQLPLLVVLENNFYSQSISQRETLAGDICARAAAFGIETRTSTTSEPATLLDEVDDCIAIVRDESRPIFLRIDTYRLMAHSKGDDDRDKSEVQAHRERDPLTRFWETNPTEAKTALDAANQRIDVAVLVAEHASFPELAINSQSCDRPTTTWSPVRVTQPDRAVTLMRDAFRRALQDDARVVFIGEDIESPYGGAFKATKGLSDEFPNRVRNTPISESLIVGLGNGLALAGMRPVCEIMFGDFLTLGADQWINHASKFRSMYNEQVSVPLVVRTPMGGRRGYGPTHSQSLEKHFLGLPDTRMLAVNHRQDPGQLYDRLFASLDRPTLVIENKVLYGQRVLDEMPDGFVVEESDESFPTMRLRPEGVADLTIVCYGEMLREVEAAMLRAFDEHELICEVLCPTQLYPLNVRPILDSVSITRRLLVVEEGIGFAAFGAELIAQIQERAPESLRQVRRLSSPEMPIPACAPLEKQMLPHAESILLAVVEMMSHG